MRLGTTRSTLALAGIALLALLVAGMIWQPRRGAPVSVNFTGFITNGAPVRVAVFQLTNHSASPFRVVGQYLRSADSLPPCTLNIALDIDPLPPHQGKTVEIQMPPLPGQWRLTAIRIRYGARPLQDRITKGLAWLVDVLPDGMLNHRLREFTKEFGGVHGITSAPFRIADTSIPADRKPQVAE